MNRLLLSLVLFAAIPLRGMESSLYEKITKAFSSIRDQVDIVSIEEPGEKPVYHVFPKNNDFEPESTMNLLLPHFFRNTISYRNDLKSLKGNGRLVITIFEQKERQLWIIAHKREKQTN